MVLLEFAIRFLRSLSSDSLWLDLSLLGRDHETPLEVWAACPAVPAMERCMANAANHPSRSWVVTDYVADARLPWSRQIELT